MDAQIVEVALKLGFSESSFADAMVVGIKILAKIEIYNLGKLIKRVKQQMVRFKLIISIDYSDSSSDIHSNRGKIFLLNIFSC